MNLKNVAANESIWHGSCFYTSDSERQTCPCKGDHHVPNHPTHARCLRFCLDERGVDSADAQHQSVFGPNWPSVSVPSRERTMSPTSAQLLIGLASLLMLAVSIVVRPQPRCRMPAVHPLDRTPPESPHRLRLERMTPVPCGSASRSVVEGQPVSAGRKARPLREYAGYSRSPSGR